MRRQVDKLDAHFIMCGYGRVGEAVARHFADHGAPFVVVDNDPDSVARAEADGFLAVRGDATADEVLEAAGVDQGQGPGGRARVRRGQHLRHAVGAGAQPEAAHRGPGRLRGHRQQAGAGRAPTTWSRPTDIGGKRMATLMLKPLVSDYLEVVTGGGELEFRVEEFELSGECCVIGRSIGDLEVRRKHRGDHPRRAARDHRRVRHQSRPGVAPACRATGSSPSAPRRDSQAGGADRGSPPVAQS